MANYYGGTGNDTLTGSLFADSLYGYGGNDTISAGGGSDTVFGGDGSDSINAGDGTDSVFAGTGNDTVTASNGYDSIFGEEGNDVLSGGSDSFDDLYGGLGDDSLYGGNFGQNWVYGGDGNDLVSAGGGSLDIAQGGAGRDTVYAGAGDDTALGGTGHDSVFGEAGNDFVAGDDGNDTVDGGLGNDTIEGGQGNDSLVGGDGADVIRGDIRSFDTTFFASGGNTTPTTVTFTNTSPLTVNLFYIDPSGTPISYGTLAPGQSVSASTWAEHNWMLTDAATGSQLAVYVGGINQTITYAGDFDDSIYGGAGADTIYTDFGNDLVYAGTENDQIFGGAGRDTVYGGGGNETADLGAGDDSFGSWNDEGGNDTVYGGAGNDNIIGGADHDLLYGGDGNDSLFGGAGSDSSFGGAGNDVGGVTDDHNTDYYDLGENAGDFDLMAFGNFASTNGVSVSFSGNDAGSYAFSGGFATGSFVGAEGISATNYNDTVNAGADTDGVTIWGNAGDDSLIGGSGADVIDGGTGHDTIYFGQGADTVFGGDGNDLIDDVGGVMVDVFANLVDAGAGDDTVYTGGGSDTIYGGTGNDQLMAEAGNDLINAGDGHDTIWASDGDDTAYGGAGNDQLSGEAGNDLLQGGGGNDSLWGGDGHDSLDGGQGADQLSGDAGNDTLDLTTADFAGDVAYGGAGNDTLTSRIDLDGGSDTLFGGDGRDVFVAGAGDSVVGGEGGDDFDTLDLSSIPIGATITFTGNGTGTASGSGAALTFTEIEAITGTAQADTVYGGADNWGMSFATGAGNDSVIGGSGADTIDAGSGNDSVQGGAGHDLMAGGTGADTLQGGAGNDVLTGGAGADVFDMVEAGGGDRITDFDLGLVGGLTTDRLDVSDLRNPDTSPVKSWDVTVTDDGFGNALLTFPEGESIILQGVSPAAVQQPGMLAAMGVPCFAAGTRIETANGLRRVENLRAGDQVCLASGGIMPILWAGFRHYPASMLASNPRLLPVRVQAGHHGARRDLVLSAQHALGVDLPDGSRALVRAGHLARLGWGVRAVTRPQAISYHHILLPRHALILANGCPAESLYPGRQALSAIRPDQRAELTALLRAGDSALLGQPLTTVYGPRCLPLLTFAQVRAQHGIGHHLRFAAENRFFPTGQFLTGNKISKEVV